MDEAKKRSTYNNPISLVGYALLVILGVWIFRDLSKAPSVQNLTTLPLGSSFEGNLKLPRERIETAFKEAIDLMDSQAKSSVTYRSSAKASDWGSFACTAIITILAGFLGQQPRSGTSDPGAPEKAQTPPPLGPGGNPRKGVIRVIAVLAAAASVLAALSSKSWSESQKMKESALALNADINSARKEIIEAAGQKVLLTAGLRTLSAR